LFAAMVDIRWQKNRARIVSKVYVSPTYHDLPPPPPTEIGRGGPFEQNDRLRDVELIGLRRLAPWRRDPIFPPRLSADGGVRPYRRTAARHGLRPQRQPLHLHRGHGPLPRRAERQGRQGDRRDQPQLALGQRRQPPEARR